MVCIRVSGIYFSAIIFGNEERSLPSRRRICTSILRLRFVGLVRCRIVVSIVSLLDILCALSSFPSRFLFVMLRCVGECDGGYCARICDSSYWIRGYGQLAVVSFVFWDAFQMVLLIVPVPPTVCGLVIVVQLVTDQRTHVWRLETCPIAVPILILNAIPNYAFAAPLLRLLPQRLLLQRLLPVLANVYPLAGGCFALDDSWVWGYDERVGAGLLVDEVWTASLHESLLAAVALEEGVDDCDDPCDADYGARDGACDDRGEGFFADRFVRWQWRQTVE